MMNQLLEKHILSELVPNGKLNCCRIKRSWISAHLPFGSLDYLLSRFPGLSTISDLQEILFRLYNSIESAPLCNICKTNPSRFISFSKGYAPTCSYKCSCNLPKCSISDHPLTDEDVLNHFIKDGKLVSTYASLHHAQLHGYYDYLRKRFPDSRPEDSVNELVYRLLHKIETRPVCPITGLPLKFRRFTEGYRTYSSLEASRQDPLYYQHKSITRAISSEKKFKQLGLSVSIDPSDKSVLTVSDCCSIHPSFQIKSYQLFNRLRSNSIVCPICNPERNPETSIEQKIKSILDDLSVPYIQHTRSIISPRELDFYLPDFKLGIECNGMFWHSGISGKSTSEIKYELAKNNSIKLLTFWEKDINNKIAIIESIIKKSLCLIPASSDFSISHIDNSTASDFISKYSLHSFIPLSSKGIFINSALSAIVCTNQSKAFFLEHPDFSIDFSSVFPLYSDYLVDIYNYDPVNYSGSIVEIDKTRFFTYNYKENSGGNINHKHDLICYEPPIKIIKL